MLRKNIIANFVGQLWGVVLSIITVPYYVRYLGVEAYALVAFNSVLLALLMLLDMGLSPTLGREVACWRAGAVARADVVGLLHSLERLFLGIALALVALGWAFSDVLAHLWFQPRHLGVDTVAECLVWMTIMAGVRWLSTLYRGGVIGLESQVWLNGLNCVIFTLRFAAIIPIIMYWPYIELFFAYQAAVVVIECAILRRYLRHGLEANRANAPSFSWRILRRHALFSSSLALSGGIWAVASQSDKLLLSKLLLLENYGYFSLAVLIAGGISILTAPILQAFAPRLTLAASRGHYGDLTSLYHSVTQLVAVITIPVGIVLAVWPDNVLLVWTGNAELAGLVAPILAWYTVGNVALAMLTPLFYLQFARGELGLHLLGSTLFLFLLVPATIFATLKHGALGAAQAWSLVNVLYLLTWVSFVHSRFVPGENWRWWTRDVLFPCGAALGAAGLIRLVTPGAIATRGVALLWCVVAWLVSLVACLLAANQLRGPIADWLFVRLPVRE